MESKPAQEKVVPALTISRLGKLRIHTLQKGNEQYAVAYDADSKTEALRQLGRWASDPDLSFNWYDAACMSQVIRTLP